MHGLFATVHTKQVLAIGQCAREGKRTAPLWTFNCQSLLVHQLSHGIKDHYIDMFNLARDTVEVDLHAISS